MRGEYAHVYLNDRETAALARHLGLSVAAFRRRHTFVDPDGWRQLRFNGGHCVFLDPETNACGVYPARPTQCRTFPFWPGLVERGEWTDEARALCEGVGRGPLHSIEDVARSMDAMSTSDDD